MNYLYGSFEECDLCIYNIETSVFPNEANVQRKEGNMGSVQSRFRATLRTYW